MNTAKLHSILANRKKGKSESVQEYYLSMKELASRGRIEDDALIQYIIDGINDLSSNKILLFGAKDMDDFKVKLKNYETFKQSADQRSSEYIRNDRNKNTGNKQKIFTNKQQIKLRCYNCGECGHKSNECPSKSLGEKCFRCGNFGHKSNKCEAGKYAKSEVVINNITENKLSTMGKRAKVGDMTFTALIDTGSEVNIIREDIAEKLDGIESPSGMIFSGFGKDNNKVCSKKLLITNTKIDDEIYEIKWHVVPSNASNLEAILGNEFITSVEININKDGLRIKKNVDESKVNIFNINIDDTNNLIDLSNIENAAFKKEVSVLITNYKPEKKMETNIEMKIIKKAHQQGHFSTVRTIEKIKQEFHIPNLKNKVETIVANCIECILNNKKNGKQEGYLHPRCKGDIPLNTYHMDHLGPLESTNKNYKHILAIIDDFSKFVWLYPTKSTTSREVISKLEVQKKNYGNPYQLITDRGTAYTSDEFRKYCEEENILHHCVTTGLPRANGQIERINSIIISVLSKLAVDDPSKWYKFVDDVQRIINSTYQRSICMTPFELLFGVKMRNKTDLKIKEIVEKEFIQSYVQARSKQREDAKLSIQKIQDENRHHYNLRRKDALSYKIGDLVAIKRIHLGPGSKLKSKFIGPYKIIKVKNNDTYDVQKIGAIEGPKTTSTCAEYLKAWVPEVKLGSNMSQNGRM